MTAETDLLPMPGKQARPHDELICELLDSRIPKSEREHAAAREIERLLAERDALAAAIDRARGEGVQDES